MKSERGEIVGSTENVETMGEHLDKIEEVKRDPFFVTRVWENAPRGYADSDTDRAEVIRAMIRVESKKLMVKSII